ncbi:MAG: hypothetical protein IJ484_04470 [Oscillospiraceae bacterium]|nr:hypothetical protein [Oscillospiraceae bacterium]
MNKWIKAGLLLFLAGFLLSMVGGPFGVAVAMVALLFVLPVGVILMLRDGVKKATSPEMKMSLKEKHEELKSLKEQAKHR